MESVTVPQPVTHFSRLHSCPLATPDLMVAYRPWTYTRVRSSLCALFPLLAKSDVTSSGWWSVSLPYCCKENLYTGHNSPAGCAVFLAALQHKNHSRAGLTPFTSFLHLCRNLCCPFPFIPLLFKVAVPSRSSQDSLPPHPAADGSSPLQ